MGTIYSKHHFIISVLLGGLLGLGLASSGLELTLMIGYATALGVGIDIDHFLIARLNSGDWAAIARCVDRPSRIFVDQESIFAEGEVTRIQRLLSHLVIGGLVVAVWLPWPDWAILSATVLYVHILTDAMADVFELYHEG